MKQNMSAKIHVETPDGSNFSVSAEGSGGGILGCISNMIHAFAVNNEVSDMEVATMVLKDVLGRTYEEGPKA